MIISNVASAPLVVSTTIGPIELSFDARAIRSIRLLDGAAKASRKPKTAPAFVHDAARALELHFAGTPQDFTRLPLDFGALPSFHARVYEAARKIPSGSMVTYGELASRAGSPGAARAVGQAMAKNPFFVVVPCHRIGDPKKLGGFSAPGGATTKRRMLEIEGAFLEAPPYDLARAIVDLERADAKLAALIQRVGPERQPRVDPLRSLFESLGRSIVYQQLSGRAAGAIHRKYAALFPDHRPTAEHLVKLSDAQLRAAGLSGAKLAALRDLGRHALDGELPTLARLRAMSDEAIVESLTRVRGIGPWTVHMLLIFRLGRPDILPTADYGVRKGFAKTYGKRELPDPRALERHAEKWRPWRSVASWYMWRAIEI